MQTQEINIEAKENTSPTIDIIVPHDVQMSCGCTNVESPSNIFKVTIDTLPFVRYMVSDVTKQSFYMKTVTVTINGTSHTIKIKVTT